MLTREEFIKFQAFQDQNTEAQLATLAKASEENRGSFAEAMTASIDNAEKMLKGFGEAAMAVVPMNAGQMYTIFSCALYGFRELLIREYQRHHEETTNV